MSCQSSTSTIPKPYDDELCRVGLYQILECLLLNERMDCPTILAISKDLIDHAPMIDSSIQVKMIVRKLKLLWQQVHDSTNSLYQSWSFTNIDKSRHTPTVNLHSTNDLRNIFTSTSMITNNINNNSEPTSVVQMTSQTITKPAVYQTPTDTAANLFLPPPIFTPLETLSQVESMNIEMPVIDEFEQAPKRTKILDTRPVEINDDEDEDGAEQIFADEIEEDDEDNDDEEGEGGGEGDVDDEDHEMHEYEDEEDISEDEDDDSRSEITDEDDEENFAHANGMKAYSQHLNLSHSNDNPSNDLYLQTMNDNLHKKFRRTNQHPFSSDRDGTHLNNNYLLNQFNGDYKINSNAKPIIDNGQNLKTTTNNNANQGGDDDDDDDIVLVSDDDSTDKKVSSKLS